MCEISRCTEIRGFGGFAILLACPDSATFYPVPPGANALRQSDPRYRAMPPAQPPCQTEAIATLRNPLRRQSSPQSASDKEMRLSPARTYRLYFSTSLPLFLISRGQSRVYSMCSQLYSASASSCIFPIFNRVSSTRWDRPPRLGSCGVSLAFVVGHEKNALEKAEIA